MGTINNIYFDKLFECNRYKNLKIPNQGQCLVSSCLNKEVPLSYRFHYVTALCRHLVVLICYLVIFLVLKSHAHLACGSMLLQHDYNENNCIQ